VEREFRPEPIWQLLYEEYSVLLKDSGISLPKPTHQSPADTAGATAIRRQAKPLAQHGTPDRIYLSAPHMSGHELDYIQEAVDTNWVAPVGPHIERFEAEFAERIGLKHAGAVSSGTAAMHLVIRHLDLQPGEEVFCSTATFAASVNPVLYERGCPVFIDSDTSTWNIDPNLLSEELERCARRGKLPRAVIAVDLYGQCADWAALRTICDFYEVPLIEDAAEALGATYGNRPAGSFGWANIFSFNGNKIITTSGGGMLATNDSTLATCARHLATQARDPAPHYEHSTVGYNYRMSNLLAGVGRAQLRVLDERIAARRAIFERYEASLSTEPGLSFMPEASYGRSNRWLTCVLIDPERFGATREEVRLHLDSRNIESRPVWKPMHLQPVFENCRRVGGEVAERLFVYGLCLPSGSSLSPSDVDRVISEFLSAPRRRASRPVRVSLEA
jgi:pyridoxal phosphate-dependent aminotransferase EpsN